MRLVLFIFSIVVAVVTINAQEQEVISVEEGEEIILDCSSLTDPKWFVKNEIKDEKSLVKIEGIYSTVGSVLRIKSLSSEESTNLYECASSDDSNSSSAKTFSLSPIPSVRQIKPLYRVIEGGHFYVECELRFGYILNKTEWEWTLNDVKLELNNRIEYKTSGTKTLLNIRLVNALEVGNVTCKATNPAGTHSQTTRLTVTNKLQALWPFGVAIVAVAIVSVLILLVERKSAPSSKQYTVNK